MPAGNVLDRNAGFAKGQAQMWGFGLDTAIDSHSYGAPGSKIFYVDPNNVQCTDLGNLGEDPIVPLATVARAIVLCRDHQGDTIVVGANDFWSYAPHNRATPILESVVIPSTKGGIRLIGVSSNPLGVSWSPAAANGVALTVHAVDVLIEGFAFYPGILANCTGIVVEWSGAVSFGENVTIRNCFFETALDYGISLDYSWYAQIYDNYFEGIAVAAIFNTSVVGDPDFAHIHHNKFFKNVLAISLPTTDNSFIHDNLFMEAAGGTNNMIDLTGGTDNLVANNFFSCTIIQYDTTCSDATSGAWLFNHCSDGSPVAPPT